MAQTFFDLSGSVGSDKRADHRRLNAHLLRTARHLIWAGRYGELTMSLLAKTAGCARKSVYNHFENVESIVVMLAIQSATRRAELAARAALYRATARERVAAIGAVQQELLPHHMRHEVLLFSCHWESISPALQTELRRQEERFHAVAAGVIRDAIAAGDLELPDRLSPESLALTLQELYVGHYSVAQRGFALGTHSLEESAEAMNWLTRTLWDDLGWCPLYSELDYPASMRKMWREVFPDLVGKSLEPGRES